MWHHYARDTWQIRGGYGPSSAASVEHNTSRGYGPVPPSLEIWECQSPVEPIVLSGWEIEPRVLTRPWEGFLVSPKKTRRTVAAQRKGQMRCEELTNLWFAQTLVFAQVMRQDVRDHLGLLVPVLAQLSWSWPCPNENGRGSSNWVS